MAQLSADQITDKLKSLPGWEYTDNSISRLYRFQEFMDGIRFINRVAELAETADHHPDISVNYTRVRFSCSTHDQGGVTEKDLKLAEQIERAFITPAG